MDGADRQGHTLHEVIEAAANGLSARLRKTRNLPAHFDREWYALVFTESQRIHLHLDKVVRLWDFFSIRASRKSEDQLCTPGS